MNKAYLKRSRISVYVAALVMSVASLLHNPAYAAPLTGTPATYTLTADFNEGSGINVIYDNDQVQLDNTTEAFNFIWVAASIRGTIVKIDTTTGDILGEYWSAPEDRPKNPSRTTVDANGNVWAGNRNEATDTGEGIKGSVVHVGLLENGQCEDRNNNGIIDTSTGLGDIKPWPNTGSADTNGGVSTAEDECIIHFVRTAGTNVRTVAVDGNNDVWIGGLGNRVHELHDGNTGLPVPGTQFNLGCGGYGGLIDGNGVLWSASLSLGGLMRYDPSISSGACLNTSDYSYGLGIDTNGFIWNTNWVSDRVTKFAPDGSIVAGSPYPTGGATGDRGVAITPADNNVWVANSGGTDISRLDNNGNFITTITVGNTPTGVSVDGDGKVWVTNYSSNNVMRIDPATNMVDLTVELGAGAGPYNYSDMTGSTITAPPGEGTWEVVHDTEIDDVEWGYVSWNASVPGDSSIEVSVATSNDSETGPFSTPETAVSGADLSVPNGRWIKVTVHFTRSTDTDADNDGIYDSPILYDLTIAAIKPFLHGKMTGGGKIGKHDEQVSHGFELHCNKEKSPNHLQVNWRDGKNHHGAANRFHLEELTYARCTDAPGIDPYPPTASFDTYQGKGSGRYNGKPGYRAEWLFTDAGEPGKHDYAEITIYDPDDNVVLSVAGNLDDGNHQALDLKKDNDDDDHGKDHI